MSNGDPSCVSAAKPRVAVCVITFRRPQSLRRLLDGLNRLAFPGEPPSIKVVVVDNDLDGSARPTCDAVAPAFKWPLEYHIESRRGIPFARNTAISCAGDEVDFVAFVDDDEEPVADWLEALLRVRADYDADVVTGPQVRRIEGDAPLWVAQSLQLRRYPTGHRLPHASTGNVLVPTEVFQSMGSLFDERVPLASGTDRRFFRRVHMAGFSIVWADDAVVYEWIPASRANARWILGRAFRAANSNALLELELSKGSAAYLQVLLRAKLSIFKGLLLLPLVLVQGRRGVVRSLWHFVHAAGCTAALTGKRSQEYQETHGS